MSEFISWSRHFCSPTRFDIIKMKPCQHSCFLTSLRRLVKEEWPRGERPHAEKLKLMLKITLLMGRESKWTQTGAALVSIGCSLAGEGSYLCIVLEFLSISEASQAGTIPFMETVNLFPGLSPPGSEMDEINKGTSRVCLREDSSEFLLSSASCGKISAWWVGLKVPYLWKASHLFPASQRRHNQTS